MGKRELLHTANRNVNAHSLCGNQYTKNRTAGQSSFTKYTLESVHSVYYREACTSMFITVLTAVAVYACSLGFYQRVDE